jgi:hypothetical protein
MTLHINSYASKHQFCTETPGNFISKFIKIIFQNCGRTAFVISVRKETGYSDRAFCVYAQSGIVR